MTVDMTPEQQDQLARARDIAENREVRYEWLTLAELETNPLYQRDPNDPQFKRIVREITETFNAALFQPLNVALSDGHKYVWDGQARLVAAQTRLALGNDVPGDRAFCMVIDATVEEQADLFVLQEHRRSVVWNDKHRANLAGNVKRDVAQAVQGVFDDLGLTLGKHGDVRAVESCYAVVEYDRKRDPDALLRPDLLKEILSTAQDAWYNPALPEETGVRKQYATSDRMIDALALLLTRFSPEELDRQKLVEALGIYDPAYFVNQSAKRTSAHGSNNKTELAWSILHVYNRTHSTNLRKNRLLPAKPKKAAVKRAA